VASKDGSYSFSSFVIGFLAGVAATLAVLILFSGHSNHRESVEAPASDTHAALRPARKAESQKALQPSLPASVAPAPDEQVQEDAAAAGMTSRSRAPSSQ
jgi:hypothetical protein